MQHYVYWIDVFTRLLYKDIVVVSLNYCIENKDLKVYAWVIMSNHVRLIIASDDEKIEIKEVVSYNMTPQSKREIKKIIYEHFDYIAIEWNKYFNNTKNNG